jgi:hypothetical protein
MNMDKNMTQPTFDIEHLIDDLKPIKPMRMGRGALITAAVALLMIGIVVATNGMRDDVMAGRPDAMFLIRSGILALLGIAAGHSVLAMASPAVGKHNQGWYWAVGAALIFPAAALVLLLLGTDHVAFSMAKYGVECLTWSGIGALATAIPMVYWLRKGAPTSAERAGWLTGIASGGLGALAFNFHCPFNDIVYTGIWYGLAVASCAVIGRLTVPHLIRW